jgi:hypothetical protein
MGIPANLSQGARSSGVHMLQIQLFFGVDSPYVSAEILHDDAFVAVVYELDDGWKVDLCGDLRGLDFGQFLSALQRSKEEISRYPNRRGGSPPDGLSRAAYSRWLMEEGQEPQ